MTDRRTLRIGHKGADAIVAGNTLASFDAALECGVDLIEFDVLSRQRDGTGGLMLAHDFHAIAAPGTVPIADALAHLAEPQFANVRFNVDLKWRGFERQAVELLREYGLESRSLISTMEVESLPLIRQATDTARLGLSVPKVRRNWAEHWATRPIAVGTLVVLRRRVPKLIARAMQAGGIDACMSHQSLVTPYFVQQVREAGGELYVWTVDDARDIKSFADMGVDGIASNDPRLFGVLDAEQPREVP